MKVQKYLKTAGWIFLVYSLIELTDCIAITLMSLGWIGNPYPAIGDAILQGFMDQQPLVFLPLFYFVTALRITAGIGLLKLRWYGYAAAWVSMFVNMIFIPVLLPVGAVDLVPSLPIVILLLLAVRPAEMRATLSE